MSGEFLMPEKNKTTFQDVMFQHLNRILDITKYEMTGGYYNKVVSGTNVAETYMTDKKEEYCQVVEAFADMLDAHFDDQMQTTYKEYEKNIDKAFEEHYNKDDLKEKSKNDYMIYSRKRLKETRKLFKALCALIKRKNYFKGVLVTDSDDNDDK